MSVLPFVIVSKIVMLIKNLIVLIFCQSTNRHPYNIVTISILRYWVKDIELLVGSGIYSAFEEISKYHVL